MPFRAGTYRLGPENGTLSVKTGRTGAAAKAGHNLLLHVSSWNAVLQIGEDPTDTSVELSADGASLRVREGTGGMQALGEEDKAKIEQTIDDDVLRRRQISFHSTRVQAAADGSGLSLEGSLMLAGKSRPIAFELAITADGTLSGSAVVKQSDWGMKPYSALLGALKVVDEVEVVVSAVLPAG